jgi:hypothetical protein
MKNFLFYGSLVIGYYALIFPQIVKSSASWRGGYFVGGEVLIPLLVLVVIELIRMLTDIVKEIIFGDDEIEEEEEE